MSNEKLVYYQGYRGEPLRVYPWIGELPNQEGQFALELIRTNGILMGAEDGEDTAGRAKLCPMPAKELAKRAVDVAQAVFQELRDRGLMLEVIPYEAALDEAREARDRN